MAEPNIIDVLLASLRRQAGRFPTELRDIELALAALELRRAFTLMDRLRTRGVWLLTEEDARALEDYWWEFGQ